MEKYVVKKFVVRIMCILICIGITMSMPACSSESKNESIQYIILIVQRISLLEVHVCLMLLCLLKIR